LTTWCYATPGQDRSRPSTITTQISFNRTSKGTTATGMRSAAKRRGLTFSPRSPQARPTFFPGQQTNNQSFILAVVAVVDQTQPVFDFAAFFYVSGVEVTPESARRTQELEEQARSQFVAEPILVPKSTCRFLRVPRQPQYRDVIQVEMSGLVVNPFDKSIGSFVRSSAGGRPGETWIWVALVRSRTQQWSVSKILVLPTQD